MRSPASDIVGALDMEDRGCGGGVEAGQPDRSGSHDAPPRARTQAGKGGGADGFSQM